MHVNGDDRIIADDQTIIGNNQPYFIWGLNNDFSFQLREQVGGEIYNAHVHRFFFNHEGRNYFELLENR